MMLLEKCMTSRKLSHFSCGCECVFAVVILSFYLTYQSREAKRCQEFILDSLLHGIYTYKNMFALLHIRIKT